jgi:hypothetical protein
MTEMNQKEPLNVLFLGGSNSVRSIMAEAILNREGMGRFRAFSAGREPSGKVHPCALDLLSKLNFDISKLHSHDGELGAARSVPGEGKRSGNSSGFRRRVPDVEQSRRDPGEPSGPIARQVVAAKTARVDRQEEGLFQERGSGSVNEVTGSFR